MQSLSRQAVIDTAARLFQSEGADAVGVDRIIAESRVAKATFYRHFPSKDVLISTVLENLHEKTMGTLPVMAEALAAKSGDHPVLALFDILSRWFASPDFNGCVFVRTALERPADDTSRQGAAMHKRALQGWIAAALQDHDGLTPSEAAEAARGIMILYDGAIVQARLHRDPSIGSTAKAAAGALLQGHGASKGRAS